METKKIVNGLLKTALVVGVAGVIIIAPNSLKAFDVIFRSTPKRKRLKELRRLLAYMKQKSLLNWRELPDGTIEMTISKKGKSRAEKVKFDELMVPKPKKWNKKWHLVIFDIPESYRKGRSTLSMKLKIMGFYQIQKSAWIYPYPCDKEITLIKQVYGIFDSHVIVAELNNIDGQELFAKHFKLL